SKAVDYVIRGEGEAAMALLARALKKGRYPVSVPGIVFRKDDETLHISPLAVRDDLDKNPLPAMNLINHSFYNRNKRGSTVIVASRGCPIKCSYCSVGAQGLKYRIRSVESVLNEIDVAINHYNARFIDFEDENLSLEKRWFLRLLHELKRRFKDMNLELRAMNGLFPPSLDKEVIQEMGAAGFKTLNLSLGTISETQLKRFNRPNVRKAVESSIYYATNQGIDTVCYIIAGAPGQSAESSVDDLLFLAGLNTIAGVSIFYPSPGSSDFELCAKEGLLPEKISLMRSTAFPVSHRTKRIESVTILRLGRILNFLKALGNKGISLPGPMPFDNRTLTGTRDEKGITLLSWFFNDGRIRGVTREGEVYENATSIMLTRQFIAGIKRLKLIK
ncbi:MAG: radical SAM protein, partial [Desulfobacterales bacterium]|nr:radical SAM protein [Desulfobacterales bacterium]